MEKNNFFCKISNLFFLSCAAAPVAAATLTKAAAGVITGLGAGFV